MCGIAGCIGYKEDQDQLEKLIEKKQKALQHRGPEEFILLAIAKLL